MASVADLHRLALTLPETTCGDGEDVSTVVGGKAMTWPYLARETPKARRLPVPGVIAIRCRIETKEMLIEAAPDRFLDDDHYRGYPAVLARLALLDEAELLGLLTSAWKAVAPKPVLRRHPEVG